MKQQNHRTVQHNWSLFFKFAKQALRGVTLALIFFLCVFCLFVFFMIFAFCFDLVVGSALFARPLGGHRSKMGSCATLNDECASGPSCAKLHVTYLLYLSFACVFVLAFFFLAWKRAHASKVNVSWSINCNLPLRTLHFSTSHDAFRCECFVLPAKIETEGMWSVWWWRGARATVPGEPLMGGKKIQKRKEETKRHEKKRIHTLLFFPRQGKNCCHTERGRGERLGEQRRERRANNQIKVQLVDFIFSTRCVCVRVCVQESNF